MVSLSWLISSKARSVDVNNNNNSNNYNNIQKEPSQPDWTDTNVMVFYPYPKDYNSKDPNAEEQLKEHIQQIQAKIQMTEDVQKEYDILKPDPTDEYKPVKTGQTGMTYTSANHFSSNHYALLFAPGTYQDCKFEVGYNVQVMGLGKSAMFGTNDSVTFQGTSGPFVEALNKDLPKTPGGTIADWNSGLCLDTFWRSAENFATEQMQWAVSQAAPLRRIHVAESLMLGDGPSYASGGFLANAKINGTTNFAAQQQWFSRHVDFGLSGDEAHVPVGGSWNMVYAGCTNAPPQGTAMYDNQITDKITSIEGNTRIRIEKPYLMMESNGDFSLCVPCPTNDCVSGSYLHAHNGDVRPFGTTSTFPGVKVGKPIVPHKSDDDYNTITDRDKALNDDLQNALEDGKDLVLCPGTIFLYKPLTVKKPGQVILGLGLATLVAPKDGSPCIRVMAKTPGVRIAGIVLEASVQEEPNQKGYIPNPFSFSSSTSNCNVDGVKSLLEFGEANVKNDVGDSNNPGLLSDIFARVGGMNLNRKVSTDVMIRIHSGHVVGDNLWLWRADHVRLAPGEQPNDPNFPFYHQTRIRNDTTGEVVNECMVTTALEVNGDNVSMYGLFCEHTVGNQVEWKGENGHVSFYQSELPYDVNQEEFADCDYVGYHVDPHVSTHTAIGVGVYCNFTTSQVRAPTGICHPEQATIQIQAPFTVYLNNLGSIQSVKNFDQGESVQGEPTLNRIARYPKIDKTATKPGPYP